MRVPRRSRVAAVAIALVAAASLSGCGDSFRALKEGECLPSDAKVVGQREASPPTVSCDQPHRYEVFTVGKLEGDSYPGSDVVDAAARQLCYTGFEPNVGFPASQMGDKIRVVYLTPTEQSWTRDDDREVECLLIFTEDREGRLAVPKETAPTAS